MSLICQQVLSIVIFIFCVDNDKINITGKNQESPYNTTTVYEQLQWPHVVVPKTLFVIIMEMSCKLHTTGTKWIEIHLFRGRTDSNLNYFHKCLFTVYE